ncbi:hypothetical protein CKO_00887 [Citrobacter koseri ATCC BAA-895]|uniref:Uncharacterized protein n=1 Tax=Citrobacter koseri (strain ATCC BAA-895 / CDC 4225-83 / SGSC4696) TaxID=290338 RepID=A8AEX5_CITK8|nr:hypothetical protein CKO_00887 [Citrobacter koseri ATCC BAA-895]
MMAIHAEGGANSRKRKPAISNASGASRRLWPTIRAMYITRMAMRFLFALVITYSFIV